MLQLATGKTGPLKWLLTTTAESFSGHAGACWYFPGLPLTQALAEKCGHCDNFPTRDGSCLSLCQAGLFSLDPLWTCVPLLPKSPTLHTVLSLAHSSSKQVNTPTFPGPAGWESSLPLFQSWSGLWIKNQGEKLEILFYPIGHMWRRILAYVNRDTRF